MSKSAADKLLAGKRKVWLGLVWGLLLACGLALPDVDRVNTQYRELGDLQAKLASREELPQRARLLAERVAQKEKDMADLKKPLVPSDALSTFKQDLARAAKTANCRLRSIRPGATKRRPLEEVLTGRPADAKRRTKAPQWEVEEQISSISLQGSFENLLEFLSALDKDVRMLQLSSMQLRIVPQVSGEIVMDLQIKTFNLLGNRQG